MVRTTDGERTTMNAIQQDIQASYVSITQKALSLAGGRGEVVPSADPAHVVEPSDEPVLAAVMWLMAEGWHAGVEPPTSIVVPLPAPSGCLYGWVAWERAACGDHVDLGPLFCARVLRLRASSARDADSCSATINLA